MARIILFKKSWLILRSSRWVDGVWRIWEEGGRSKWKCVLPLGVVFDSEAIECYWRFIRRELHYQEDLCSGFWRRCGFVLGILSSKKIKWLKMHHPKCQGDDSDSTLWLYPKKGTLACFSDMYSQETFPVLSPPLFSVPFALWTWFATKDIRVRQK